MCIVLSREPSRRRLWAAARGSVRGSHLRPSPRRLQLARTVPSPAWSHIRGGKALVPLFLLPPASRAPHVPTITMYMLYIFNVLWSREGREGFAGLLWAPDVGDFPVPFPYGNSTAADSWKPDPWDKHGRTETAVSVQCFRLSVQRQARASLTWNKAVSIKIALLSHRHPVGLGGGKSYIEQPRCFQSHETYWHAFSKRLMTYKALRVNYLLSIYNRIFIPLLVTGTKHTLPNDQTFAIWKMFFWRIKYTSSLLNSGPSVMLGQILLQRYQI